MSDQEPFEAARATNVPAPATEYHGPKSVVGWGAIGIHMINCRNVTVEIQATNDPERALGWASIFFDDRTSGGTKKSVTFGALSSSYHLSGAFPYAYMRVSASYTDSSNDMLVMIRRA